MMVVALEEAFHVEDENPNIPPETVECEIRVIQKIYIKNLTIFVKTNRSGNLCISFNSSTLQNQ